MSWFGRKKRNEPQAAPAAPAPKAQPDFLSPLWTNWPPVETAPVPPVQPVEPEVHQAMPEPLITPPPAPPPPAPIKPIIIVTPPPPSPPPMLAAPAPAPIQAPIPARSNPPPVADGPAVVVQRVRQITEPPPPVQPRAPVFEDFDHPTPRRVPVVPPEARQPTPQPARPLPALPPVAAIPTPPPLPVRSTQRPPAASPHELMRGSMQRGDWLSARALADKILAYDPTDLDAHACIEACTQNMRDSIEVRLGDRSRILRVAVPDQWLAEMALDPRAAYLLSRIDGVSTIDAILDVSGMAESEGAKLLVDLLEEGVLEAHKPLPRVSSRPPR